MRLNISADDVDFEPIPSGKYRATVLDGELKQSGENAKHPGAHYINWELQIVGGDYEGRKLWTNTIVDHDGTDELPGCDCGDEDLIKKFNQGLRGAAQLIKHTGNDPEGDWEIDDIIGNEVGIVVGISTYEGEKRNEVKRFVTLEAVGGASDSALLP